MMENWADFFPYFAMGFKLIVLGIAAFFAIKWHVDQDRLAKEKKNNTPSA
ncbi:hypothetical protein [Vibrio caribbeanicus]|jgi:hypothetical protein|nr:hypothetical protein [Vibrio caribbeanicus]MCY9843886.1 hypothetical protein [Vibrio caribbeanicus]